LLFNKFANISGAIAEKSLHNIGPCTSKQISTKSLIFRNLRAVFTRKLGANFAPTRRLGANRGKPNVGWARTFCGRKNPFKKLSSMYTARFFIIREVKGSTEKMENNLSTAHHTDIDRYRSKYTCN
jgi:hypothetical protein